GRAARGPAGTGGQRPRALRARGTGGDARVADGLSAVNRQLRGLCAARLTRNFGLPPGFANEGRLPAKDGYDDGAAGPDGPAAVGKRLRVLRVESPLPLVLHLPGLARGATARLK